jgi:hypothetical protein
VAIVMIPAVAWIGGCGEKPNGPPNHPPTIMSITTSNAEDELLSGETVTISVDASDPEGDHLTFSYQLDGNTIPGSGSQTDFIAPSGEGTHTILVTVSDGQNTPVSDNIEITVCNSQSFGIYSEGEHCKLVFDKNSFLGMYRGGHAVVNEFDDDTQEKSEGLYSKKMETNVGLMGDWAGWFVMYGKEGTPDTHTRDMRLFDGGTLRFSIKSEIDDLVASIRSGDVTAGTEYVVQLKNFSQFKVGEWVELSIPLVQFTDPPPGKPRVDLSITKILFNIASNEKSGGTSGDQAFWVDNVRWVRAGY